MELIEHFMEYELAITEIYQYYDLPLVSYSYTDDMLFPANSNLYKTLTTTDIGIVWSTDSPSTIPSK